MPNGFYYSVPLLIAMFGQVDETPDPDLNREDKGRVTLGGTQYWTDQLVCHGWRIQRHVKFGQCRLLKPTNRVAQAGTFEQCRLVFDSAYGQSEAPRIPPTVLVSVHGLGRTRKSMSSIGQYVSEQGNFGWVNFGYASTRDEITNHAAALRNVLDELALLKRDQDVRFPPVDEDHIGLEFHFVAHSMGNIVLRKLFSTIEQNEAERKPVAWRVGRMVMLAPPNQGSAMASLLKNSITFRLIAGQNGRDLGAQWDKLQKALTTPPCEFAIIAGGKSDEKGYNPLLAGDDDLIVRVEETRLAGATDFAVIPAAHTFLMDRRESIEMTLRFLQSGYLRSAEQREQIP